jgi:hypothetical protein
MFTFWQENSEMNQDRVALANGPILILQDFANSFFHRG